MTQQKRKESSTLPTPIGDRPPLILYSPSPPGEEKGSGDEVGKHAQFAFCELHRVQEETLEGLVLSVRVVLSEAVLVLEPTAINIATMNDKSWLIEVTGFRVRVPLH